MVSKPHPGGEPLMEKVELYLKSRDILERLKAIEMLRELGDKQRLISLLYSESWHTREKAAEALATFGDAVKDDILPLLDEGYWFVRAAAAYILGEIGDVRAVPKLLERLQERNESVKGEAAKALAKILHDHPEVQTEIESDLRLLMENILKDLKEFDLLEGIRKARVHGDVKKNSLLSSRD